MKTVTRLKTTLSQRQRGAVAITFAFSLLLLMGFMALVFDLGRTYVVRTELQNAADAAALAGAKDLNQKLSGVIKARATAIAIGGENDTKFSFNGNAGIEITEAMISVSNCPDDACTWTQASTITDAQAADKTFLKVHIPSDSLATFFARVPTTLSGTGIQETRTYGRAVAGWFTTQISPIGVCALDLNEGGTRDLSPPTADKELTEYGYRRGIAYDLMQLGKISNGNPFLLNPVDPWTSAGEPCESNHSNAPYARDFVCTGASASIRYQPDNPDYKYGYAYGNTGYSWGPVRDALNSRFKPETCAPQDANRREYAYNNPAAGYPRDWMNPDPDLQQSIRIERDPVTDLPYVYSPLTSREYGVLWSYSRAVRAIGSSPNATAGTPFELDQWSALYPVSSPPNLSADASVYLTDTVRPYDTSIDATGGVPDRRVLNIAIIDCGNVTGGQNCNSKIPVLGVGKFFMQTQAVNPKSIYAEFDGLINPIPSFEIRLYR